MAAWKAADTARSRRGAVAAPAGKYDSFRNRAGGATPPLRYGERCSPLRGRSGDCPYGLARGVSPLRKPRAIRRSPLRYSERCSPLREPRAIGRSPLRVGERRSPLREPRAIRRSPLRYSERCSPLREPRAIGRSPLRVGERRSPLREPRAIGRSPLRVGERCSPRVAITPTASGRCPGACRWPRGICPADRPRSAPRARRRWYRTRSALDPSSACGCPSPAPTACCG